MRYPDKFSRCPSFVQKPYTPPLHEDPVFRGRRYRYLQHFSGLLQIPSFTAAPVPAHIIVPSQSVGNSYVAPGTFSTRRPVHGPTGRYWPKFFCVLYCRRSLGYLFPAPTAGPTFLRHHRFTMLQIISSLPSCCCCYYRRYGKHKKATGKEGAK